MVKSYFKTQSIGYLNSLGINFLTYFEGSHFEGGVGVWGVVIETVIDVDVPKNYKIATAVQVEKLNNRIFQLN